MNYVIYQLKSGNCKYVGSSVNFKRRFSKHLKDLKENKHCNDYLQSEYNRTGKIKYKILQSGFTLFKEEILRDEQRWINRLSNSNESTASKVTRYSRREFMQDTLDTLVRYWKWFLVLLVLVLVFGYGLSTEQAFNFARDLYRFFMEL